MIEGTTLVGSAAEIAEKITEAGKHGLTEVSLLPPLNHIREAAKEFAEEVIPLC